MYKKNVFIMLNIIIPILAGSSLYYLLSPNVIFVKSIDDIIGTLHTLNTNNNMFLSFIRCYFLDMLWAYALVFALFFILQHSKASLTTTFFTAFLFSTFMEILQLTDFAGGTFDVIDIAVEGVAEAIAIFIILFFTRRNLHEEKK